jgi:predicted short-subunit dehydrogenase-like oxidoreductase (DUF2520 family)
MARKLQDAGWHVTAVVTRSDASASRAVRQIGAGRPYGKITRMVLGAGVVLIAVPDDAIYPVAEQLALMGGEELRGKIILHTSGSLDRGVLVPLERVGASTGSIHPLQSFSRRVVPSLGGVFMVIEGMPAAIRTARRMARDLDGVPLRLQGGDKRAYHAAGVFSAAHLLTLLEAGTQILMKSGFSRRQAVSALLQLSRQVLSNFERFGPAAAWSGPLARGDFGTITGHTRALKNFPREYGEAYAAAHRLGARVLSRKPDALLKKLKPVLRTR